MKSNKRKSQVVLVLDPVERQKRMDRYARTYMEIDLDLHLLTAMIDLAAYVECEEREPTTISDYGPTLGLVLNDVRRRAYEIMERCQAKKAEANEAS